MGVKTLVITPENRLIANDKARFLLYSFIYACENKKDVISHVPSV